MRWKAALFLFVFAVGFVRVARAELPWRQRPLNVRNVRLRGLYGQRFDRNWRNRLLETVKEDALVRPFETRASRFPWIGEFVGKWLDAASLSYACVRDEKLRKKMDSVVQRLVATQEPDGYLGTYPKGKRFIMENPYTWDVWVHKYVMIGLLRYAEVVGDRKALAAARRAADLLLQTFGPNKKDLVETGTHVGMAATSVLQPMVWLYRATGDERYLDFCRYIISSYDEPHGPRILSELKKGTPVCRIANAKAYEMLSNFLGLVEFAAATGDVGILKAVEGGWDDVYRNRLYITGGASSWERFRPDNDFPYTQRDRIQETCVTVTWIQLTQALLSVTGKAKYADALMWSVTNQLLGAQRPDGRAWCYYCPLRGHKQYDLAIHCCSSNGPRAVAAIPYFAVTRSDRALFVNLYAAGDYGYNIDGSKCTLRITGNFPFRGRVTICPVQQGEHQLRLNLFVPRWADGTTLILPDGGTTQLDGGPRYETVDRNWKAGESVKLDWNFQPRLVSGGARHPGMKALCYGPLVLAWDSTVNRGDDRGIWWKRFSFAKTESSLDFQTLESARAAGPVYAVRGKAVFGEGVREVTSCFRPWCYAGAEGGYVCVWFPTKLPKKTVVSAFFGCKETWSDPGNVDGSVCDEDTASFRVTYNGRPQKEAWFAVQRTTPVTILCVEYVHGKTFHDGGWYDASKGKPRIQVKRTLGGKWQDLAVIETYPATTATDARGLRGGESFRVDVPPTQCVGVRVIGTPACGDNPAQRFASCAELRAFTQTPKDQQN